MPTIESINFKVGARSYGLRAGPRGQIIFVENLWAGEYERVSSYNVREDSQNSACGDITTWVLANEEGPELSPSVRTFQTINSYLDIFYKQQ